jgi:hypothetical protein
VLAGGFDPVSRGVLTLGWRGQLLDERLLDLRLAPPLLAGLVGRPLCQSLHGALRELTAVDPALAKQVRRGGEEGLAAMGAERRGETFFQPCARALVP